MPYAQSMGAQYHGVISTAPEITRTLGFLKGIEHIKSNNNFAVTQALTSACGTTSMYSGKPWIFWSWRIFAFLNSNKAFELLIIVASSLGHQIRISVLLAVLDNRDTTINLL